MFVHLPFIVHSLAGFPCRRCWHRLADVVCVCVDSAIVGLSFRQRFPMFRFSFVLCARYDEAILLHYHIHTHTHTYRGREGHTRILFRISDVQKRHLSSPFEIPFTILNIKMHTNNTCARANKRCVGFSSYFFHFSVSRSDFFSMIH